MKSLKDIFSLNGIVNILIAIICSLVAWLLSLIILKYFPNLPNKIQLKYVGVSFIFLFSFGFLFFLKRIVIKKIKNEVLEEEGKKHLELVKLIKKFICYNQGWLAQFSFLAGEIHKNIKSEYNKGDKSNPKTLEKNCKIIEGQLNEYLSEIFKKNCNYFFDHFNNRSQKKPRVCLKIVLKNGDVAAMYRDRYEYTVRYPIDDNKGFKTVNKNGNPYFCNDIPQAARDEKYYNYRLDNKKVKRLYFNNFNEKKPAQNNINWQECWKKNEIDGELKDTSFESCYKSTLIIPLTLVNNDGLQDSFRKHFKIPHLVDENSNQRAIYGYLCFDHQETDYFIEEIDCRIGYVFADILSVYLIHMLVFTQYSETYNNACNVFKK
ncbi:MAG: hypothetical protein GY714_05745 [Desulfobacterales bacterium]|nr:hypothetical protein [Desulfobacterales bacterium]MCP4160458.1 hypothetical protein [Deltaproteobacteria bacterium]